MTKEEKTLAIAGMLGGMAFLILVAPLIYIWGWNQVFGSLHRIEYTFWNWLGVIALSMFFKTSGISIKKPAQS